MKTALFAFAAILLTSLSFAQNNQNEPLADNSEAFANVSTNSLAPVPRFYARAKARFRPSFQYDWRHAVHGMYIQGRGTGVRYSYTCSRTRWRTGFSIDFMTLSKEAERGNASGFDINMTSYGVNAFLSRMILNLTRNSQVYLDVNAGIAHTDLETSAQFFSREDIPIINIQPGITYRNSFTRRFAVSVTAAAHHQNTLSENVGFLPDTRAAALIGVWYKIFR